MLILQPSDLPKSAKLRKSPVKLQTNRINRALTPSVFRFYQLTRFYQEARACKYQSRFKNSFSYLKPNLKVASKCIVTYLLTLRDLSTQSHDSPTCLQETVFLKRLVFHTWATFKLVTHLFLRHLSKVIRVKQKYYAWCLENCKWFLQEGNCSRIVPMCFISFLTKNDR